MGYAGKLELKRKARLLREKGFSIKEIERQLKVSRSSVSIWVRDVELTKAQIEKLYVNKRTGALRGCMVAAANKIRRTKEIEKRLKQEGEREVGRMLKRDRFIAGVALYFAEGEKTRGKASFSNSDSRAIKFMVGWFREFCLVPEEKFRCSIYLHDNLSELKAKRFWSRLTEVPFSQFTKTYIVKNNPNRLRKAINQFGVLRITVNDVKLQRKIIGWISGTFKN